MLKQKIQDRVFDTTEEILMPFATPGMKWPSKTCSPSSSIQFSELNMSLSMNWNTT
jgi:hypothetical protein